MRILYFIENNWVFGKIFNELIKYLHPDIDGDILCWDRLYATEEAEMLRDKYDLYFSTPVGCFFLHDNYGWPLEKCYAQAHSEFDIADALARFPKEYFDQLAGYAAVSPFIWQASLDAGVSRVSAILPVGVTTANYARPISKKVSRLGYFGRMHRSDVDGQPDIKRGYLAAQVAERTGLEFYNREYVHFLAADRLYQNVDLVMFCSTTEGNPYVAIEAAAAGLPTLGTGVGIFPAIASAGGGIVLPTDETEFVDSAVVAIERLKANYDLYFYMSNAATMTSKAFDWEAIKSLWLDEFYGVFSTDALKRKDSHVAKTETSANQADTVSSDQTTN